MKKNLEAAGLRPKRAYLVSRSVMMRVVKGEAAIAAIAAIDEHDLHGDLVDVVEGA